MSALPVSRIAQCLFLLALTAGITACGGGAANPPEALAATEAEQTPSVGTPIDNGGAAEPIDTTDTSIDTGGELPDTELPETELPDTELPEEQPEIIVPSTEVDLATPVFCDTDKQRFNDVMLARINAARAQARMCGDTSFPVAASVTWNSKLQSAAEIHSSDMTTHNFFSHTGSDGSSVSARADVQNYEWRAIGENIAAGQNTAQEVIEGWLDSPGHCRNLMNSSYTEIAVACVSDSNADYQRYWTNVLGAPLR